MIIGASGGSAPEWFETSSAPPLGRHVLDALQLHPEPVAVVEVEQRLDQVEDALRAPPVVDLARPGSAAGMQLAQRARVDRLLGRRRRRQVEHAGLGVIALGALRAVPEQRAVRREPVAARGSAWFSDARTVGR